jgi:hypothetical protein
VKFSLPPGVVQMPELTREERIAAAWAAFQEHELLRDVVREARELVWSQSTVQAAKPNERTSYDRLERAVAALDAFYAENQRPQMSWVRR